MKIDFYNLDKLPFESGLVRILDKAYAAGNRILIKTSATASLERLLWEQEPNSWLPHGTDNPEQQPIFISTDAENKNDAQVLILLNENILPPEEGYERCLYVFDGRNAKVREEARAIYKQCLDKKYELQYHNL